MICPRCKTQLTRTGRDGSPMLKTRGLLIKSMGVVAICPNSSCKGDVPATREIMQALGYAAVLYFDPPLDKNKTKVAAQTES